MFLILKPLQPLIAVHIGCIILSASIDVTYN